MELKDIISNVIDELQRARERILELGEFDEQSITSDEELVSDIDMSIERLSSVNDTVLIALCLAVYAGNIEANSKGFVDDFGADSFKNREKYLELAEQYELPIGENGLIESDIVYNDLWKIAEKIFVDKEEERN